MIHIECTRPIQLVVHKPSDRSRSPLHGKHVEILREVMCLLTLIWFVVGMRAFELTVRIGKPVQVAAAAARAVGPRWWWWRARCAVRPPMICTKYCVVIDSAIRLQALYEMRPSAAVVVMQAYSRGHAVRSRMKSPFFRAAVRAGFLRRSHAAVSSSP